MIGPGFERGAESSVETESVEKIKDAGSKLELPDDSGDRVYKSELPDDSGEKMPESEQADKVQEGDYPSTYKERLDQTPNESGDRGYWTGERGESKFIPSDKEIADILAQFGKDGVSYQDAIPDFSDFSACTVQIDNMTEKRPGIGGNFDQCDHKCAEQWNKECKDGKSDWTAGDVRNWREANGYSWHERNDMKTCDLIPTKVNDYFGHLGGVGECRRRDAGAIGGDFDE